MSGGTSGFGWGCGLGGSGFSSGKVIVSGRRCTCTRSGFGRGVFLVGDGLDTGFGVCWRGVDFGCCMGATKTTSVSLSDAGRARFSSVCGLNR